MPVRLLGWDAWVAFAGASLYLLWELVRVSDALAELADMWNEQYQEQNSDRDEYLRKRRERRGKPQREEL
ncbi:hypothetical protein ABT167_05575 [Streptomyces sp. NPDC001792]|uniref:hypothetical protein n=1 Tax=Streptomyces sp. NPDC001792 TaxID=3154524 RepID=UPI003323FA4C